MTRAMIRPQPENPSDVSDSAGQRAECPVQRSITAHLTGGLDGVLRVVTMLRGRAYRVRDLSADVGEGVVETRVRCTVVLTAAGTSLLLERLRRMPVVVSAEAA